MSAKAILGFFLILTLLSMSSCASQPKIKTGIDMVDDVVTAILDANVAQQRELMAFRAVACTTADGLGGPPKCEDGEEYGLLIEVFPILGPEGHFIRKANLNDWPGIQVKELYAVYQVSETVFHDELYPIGDYAALFTTEEEQIHIVIHIREDGIVRMDYQFLSSLDEILKRDASEVLLMP